MRAKLVISAFVIMAVGLLFVAMSGCGDKGVNPRPVKGYYVYWGAELSKYRLYRYSTGTRILDSIPMPYDLWVSGFAVSPEGKKMYLIPENDIMVFDLDSLDLVDSIHVSWDLPFHQYGKNLFASPDGRLLAVANNGLQLVNLATSVVEFSDTSSVYYVNFSEDSRYIIYFISYDAFNYTIRRIDLYNGFGVSDIAWSPERPHWLVELGRENKWCIYNNLPYANASLELFDLETDSSDIILNFCPGGGEMLLTSDESFLVFTGRPSQQGYCPGFHGYAFIFDLETKSIVDSILPFLSQPGTPIEICFTPDNRYLMGLAETSDQIFIYDWSLRMMDTVIDYGDYFVSVPYNLQCQTRR